MTAISLRRKALIDIPQEDYVIECAWCGVIKIKQCWRPRKPRDRHDHVSHGICPDCYERVIREHRRK
jgi:hypothetical protein